MDQTIFKKVPGFAHFLYIVHSEAPLSILENFFFVIVELYQDWNFEKKLLIFLERQNKTQNL